MLFLDLVFQSVLNKAPFDKLELDFNENEIATLSAMNGRGKTTIISHIIDAFYEMAKPHFANEFAGKENKFYRLSSSTQNLFFNRPSFVYLRFRISKEEFIDYVEVRNNCLENEYNEAIDLKNKISFDEIKPSLEQSSCAKIISQNFNKQKAEELFKKNILTYFPSYRYEVPGYLNDPYKTKLDFRKQSDFSGFLKNPIEVMSGLPQLANWIMDVALDSNLNPNSNQILVRNINLIITNSIAKDKFDSLRFGIGPRNSGNTRIQIIGKTALEEKIVYPTIFGLSSGESSVLCIFGELLKQADSIKNNIQLDEIAGIVVIDEIDKHLHIKLQKEVLPKLLKLFPNVQFIISSHSPFLSMGLAEEAVERSKIIDLDNFGISKDPTTNELYKEVYNMMVGENDRFKEMYQTLKEKINIGTIPLVITEGKTDIQHIKKSKEKLSISDCDVEFFEVPEKGWGSSQLKTLLENLSKVPQTKKIVGIFDRDEIKIIEDIEKDGQSFKSYGNNVFAFCIPNPEFRKDYSNVSIEFYYTDDELKTKNNGKCLYFDNEVKFEQSASNKGNRKLIKREAPEINEETVKKIFDEDIGNLDWLHSKSEFANLVDANEDFAKNFNFENFNLIFEKIKQILSQQ